MLALDDVSIAFRRYRGILRQEETPRLSGVTLSVGPGEVVAVIGPSGAGKSLLVHAVLGILPPNAVLRGRMRFRGHTLDARSLAALRGREIALLPQQIGHLDPLARAGAQIRWAARRAGVAPRLAERLAAFDLPPATARLYPHQLSGGMARRVMMAVASAGGAGLIVADEPTAGLDEANGAIVLDHLRAHADRGGAALVVSHDLALALPRCDRVAILDGGRIRAVEPAAAFAGAGDALAAPEARALWRALPQNAFAADA